MRMLTIELLVLLILNALPTSGHRVTAGSGGPLGHAVHVSGLGPGDAVKFVRGSDCEQGGGENSTAPVLVPAGGSNVTVRLLRNMISS